MRAGRARVGVVARAVPATSFVPRAVVRAHAPAREVRLCVPPALADIESDPFDGGCTLVVGTDDLDWLAAYLFGLPWSFEVVEPPALRALVRERADAIARRHPILG